MIEYEYEFKVKIITVDKIDIKDLEVKMVSKIKEGIYELGEFIPRLISFYPVYKTIDK